MQTNVVCDWHVPIIPRRYGPIQMLAKRKSWSDNLGTLKCAKNLKSVEKKVRAKVVEVVVGVTASNILRLENTRRVL